MGALRHRSMAAVLSPVLATCIGAIPQAQATAANAVDATFQAIYKAEWKWRQSQTSDDDDSQRGVATSLARVDSEVARLHGGMLAVMKETGFTGDFPSW